MDNLKNLAMSVVGKLKTNAQKDLQQLQNPTPEYLKKMDDLTMNYVLGSIGRPTSAINKLPVKDIIEKQKSNLLLKLEDVLPLKSPVSGFEKNIIDDTDIVNKAIKAIAGKKDTRDLIDQAIAVLKVRGLMK